MAKASKPEKQVSIEEVLWDSCKYSKIVLAFKFLLYVILNLP